MKNFCARHSFAVSVFFTTASLVFPLLITPTVASALVFSEVMYDPDGTDSGREWVEVYNDGAASVDLTGVALVEGTTRHKISVYLGGASTITSGAYAIIADKPELFLADYPSVSLVFDSTFSLSNTGETLALSESAESADADSISWTSDVAATGGKSWQRSGEAWVAALASP